MKPKGGAASFAYAVTAVSRSKRNERQTGTGRPVRASRRNSAKSGFSMGSTYTDQASRAYLPPFRVRILRENEADMTETRTSSIARDESEYRPQYLAAALVTLGVFVLYAITLSPTTWFWDTSEYIATAHILGIPHPPGNPLFVLLARTWDLLLTPFGLPVAVRINLFSATMGALAHGCWFLLADRVLAFYSTDRVFRLIGACAAVLISATAYTVWNQSNVNEKVYTVSLFTIALLSFLAFRWRDRLGVGKD